MCIFSRPLDAAEEGAAHETRFHALILNGRRECPLIARLVNRREIEIRFERERMQAIHSEQDLESLNQALSDRTSRGVMGTETSGVPIPGFFPLAVCIERESSSHLSIDSGVLWIMH